MDSLQLIYDSIEELNADLEDHEKIQKDLNTHLFGSGDSLDSLQLVSLLSIIEQRLEDETGDYIAIADEKAMSLDESPFKTVMTLRDYINKLVA